MTCDTVSPRYGFRLPRLIPWSFGQGAATRASSRCFTWWRLDVELAKDRAAVVGLDRQLPRFL